MKRAPILMTILMTILVALAIAAVTAAATELCLLVEAEDFVREDGGTVERLSGRTMASGGKSVRNWDFPGHALEWDVTIPEGPTLAYKFVIRFNCKEDAGIDLIRDLKIDGQYPAEAFKKITFNWTGGWSSGANNWQNRTVCDDKGQPVFVELKPGKHVVRTTNINGRIGLDSFGIMTKGIWPEALGPAGPPVERPAPAAAPATPPAQTPALAPPAAPSK